MKKVISVLLSAILLTCNALPSHAAEEALLFGAQEAAVEASVEASALASSLEEASESSSEEASIEGDYSAEESSESSSEASSVEVVSSAEESASSEEASAESSEDSSSVEVSLPEDYFTEYPTGYLDIDTGVTYESVTENADSAGIYSASYLPSYYVTQNLPELKSQWPYGTCWAFAANALAEINLAQKNALTDLSELQLAYFGYRWVDDPLGGFGDPDHPDPIPGNLNIGGRIEQALTEYTRGEGLADESVAPYATDAVKANTTGLDDSLAYLSSAYLMDYCIQPIDVKNLAPIKQLIMQYGAVAVSFHADSSINSSVNAGIYNLKNNCFYNKKDEKPNHAVAIVGWDDSFSRTKFTNMPPGDGAFLVRNSWSTGSFDDNQKYSGYFWMSYYEASLESDAYAADFAPGKTYDNTYQYDLYVNPAYAKCLKAANIYRAGGDGEYGEFVKAVGFATNSSNLKLQIDIYKDVTDVSDIKGQKPASTKIVTTTYSGFHTAELDDAVYVKKGSTFAVVITDLSGNGFGLAAEHESNLSGPDIPGGSYYFGISTSQSSFAVPSGWDLWLVSQDLAIKAYTVNSTEEIDELKDMTIGYSIKRFPVCTGDEAGLYVNTVPEDYELKEEVKWSYAPKDMVSTIGDGRIRFEKPGYVTISATAEGKSTDRQFAVFPSETWFRTETDGKGNISFTWDKIEAATGYEFKTEDGSKSVYVEEDGRDVHSLSLDWFCEDEKSGKRTVRVYTYYADACNVLNLTVDIAFEEQDTPVTEIRILDTQRPPHLLGSSQKRPTTYLYGKEYTNDPNNITLSGPEDLYGDEAGVLKLGVGKSYSLKADLLPKVQIISGQKITYKDKAGNRSVLWTSGNTAIAAVSSAGKVTGKRAGTTVIKLTDPESGLIASCPVTVYDPVTSITLSKKTLKLGVGQRAEIKAASILPATASDTLIFTSSKPSIVSVSDPKSGIIEAKAEGTAVITATAEGGKTATCTVTVGKAVEKMKLSGKSGKDSVAVGRTLQMVTTFNDGDGKNQPVNKSVTYGIVDSGKVVAGNEYASITAKGVLKGLAEGMVTVRATSLADGIDGESAYADTEIYVYSGLKSASMSRKSLTMVPGSSYTLSVKLKSLTGDAHVTTGEIRWNCKPEGALELRDNGDGSCRVTAPVEALSKPVTVTASFTAYGASKPAALSCKISVKSGSITSLKVTPSAVSMNRGETAKLSADLAPLVPADGRLLWEVKSGYEEDLCLVDKDGNGVQSIATDGPDENFITVRAKSTGKLVKGKAFIKVTTLAEGRSGKPLSKEIRINLGNEATRIVIKKGNSPVVTALDTPRALCSGKSISLNAVVYADDAGTKAGDQKVIWKSDSPEVATVSASGKVTAVACGVARITARSRSMEGLEEAVYVGVYSDSKKVTLERTKLTLNLAEETGADISLPGQYDVLGAIIANEDMFNNDISLGAYSDKIKWTVSGSGSVKLAAVDSETFRKAKGIGRKQEYLASLKAAYKDPSEFEGTGKGQLLAIKATGSGTVKLTAVAGSKKATITVTIKVNK